MNPAFLKIWGYDSPHEILGINFTSLFKEVDKAQEIAKSLLKGSNIESVEPLGKRRTVRNLLSD
jgi:PAS domain-containing protein